MMMMMMMMKMLRTTIGTRAWLLVLLATACVPLAQAAGPYNCSCVGSSCFSAVAHSASLAEAEGACGRRSGVLAAVRSERSSRAIGHLLEGLRGVFWIGLRLTGSGCSDPSSRLRGYTWAAGDNDTDFAGWKGAEPACAPSCVSISGDLGWTERPCDDILDGYICESRQADGCGGPEQMPDPVVVYNGTGAGGLCSIRTGSVALGVPSGLRYICGDGEWFPAPWGCEVHRGGCEFACITHNHSPRCVCPPGKTLGPDRVSCVEGLHDPCHGLSCDHHCIPQSGCGCRQGYELAEDGRLCRDINECADSRHCNGMTCVNKPGGFECVCPPGFELSGNKCVDINECQVNPCDQICDNTPGSFTCSCINGFKKVGDLECKHHCPTEECPALCDPHQPDQCDCPDGFISDTRETGTVCVDINECEQHECDMNCENTYGSFICSCEKGYQLMLGYKCLKVDEEVTQVTTPTPTPTDAKTKVSSVSPGSLFAIIACVVVMVLLSLFLFHLKLNSKWIFKGIRNNNSDDMKDLQQVTTEDNMAFPDRHSPQDTY